MQVRWTRPASRDLENIVRRIRQDNPAAARRVAETPFNAGSALDNLPHRGRAGRIAGTRELIFSPLPYIAVYRVREQTVEILRIYHAAQDWP